VQIYTDQESASSREWEEDTRKEREPNRSA